MYVLLCYTEAEVGSHPLKTGSGHKLGGLIRVQGSYGQFVTGDHVLALVYTNPPARIYSGLIPYSQIDIPASLPPPGMGLYLQYFVGC